jgi:5-methylcytosine-specific restriction endonuclease McrBC GTP-binding regulatory subunit McrB
LIPVEDLTLAANKAIAERKAARESNTFKDDDSQFRNGAQIDNDFRDEFMIQMLHWFKKDFFEWVNELPCNSCKVRNSL